MGSSEELHEEMNNKNKEKRKKHYAALWCDYSLSGISKSLGSKIIKIMKTCKNLKLCVLYLKIFHLYSSCNVLMGKKAWVHENFDNIAIFYIVL